MRKSVIVSAVRTAIGSFNGALSSVPAIELGITVISEVIKRALLNSEDVDEVIMGNVLQAGLGQNPARQAGLGAELPTKIYALTVNEVCASGLKAVALAAQAIKTGNAEVVVAGGMENMSRAPFLLDKARFGYRLGDGELVDSLVHDGLWDIYNNYHMGITAENLAEKYTISRKEQDIFAAYTQKECAQAIKEGKFKEEIVATNIPQRKGEPILFNTDEFPKPETTMEKLSSLKPAFKQNGTITAGNASGINDGAAALVVMAEEKAKSLELEPMAEIVSYASAGVEPAFMGWGAVPATRKALDRAHLKIDELDLIELNEAFAAQSIAVNREMGWDESKVNVNGGAIALGHPIGASGARILVTLLYEMRRRKAKCGLATLCVGGGEGMALIVKREK